MPRAARQMQQPDDTMQAIDVQRWEDELIFAELEAGLCPWIFTDTARVEL